MGRGRIVRLILRRSMKPEESTPSEVTTAVTIDVKQRIPCASGI
jgi:hypothetical protein